MFQEGSEEYIAHQRKSDGTIQTLENHLLGVGVKAKSFAAKIGLEQHGEVIGLLHDLGKYSKQFQIYIESAVGLLNPDEDADYVNPTALKGKVDHSSAGAQYIWQRLAAGSQFSAWVGQILSLCIASHHSGLCDCLSPDGEDTFKKRMNKEEERAHLHEVTDKLDNVISEKANQLLSDKQFVLTIVQIILKIQSQSKESIIRHFNIGLLVRYLFSCLIDADRLDTANFENPKAAKLRYYGNYPDWRILIERLEDEFNNFRDSNSDINKLRRYIAGCCLKRASDKQGIYTLTVPTGGGKTLASLRFALTHAKCHELDRIIYVVPFTSIIDQNAARVRVILEKSDKTGTVVLEHHSNITPEKQTWQSKILSENWDAPIV